MSWLSRLPLAPNLSQIKPFQHQNILFLQATYLVTPSILLWAIQVRGSPTKSLLAFFFTSMHNTSNSPLFYYFNNT